MLHQNYYINFKRNYKYRKMKGTINNGTKNSSILHFTDVK